LELLLEFRYENILILVDPKARSNAIPDHDDPLRSRGFLDFVLVIPETHAVAQTPIPKKLDGRFTAVQMGDRFEPDLGVFRKAHTPLFDVDDFGRYIRNANDDFTYEKSNKQPNDDQKKSNH
jgi:hypothetical protein